MLLIEKNLRPFYRQLLLVFFVILVTPAASFPQSTEEAIVAYRNQDFQAALSGFKENAEDGSADAQYYLGLMYWLGHGVEADIFEAVSWFELSADQGKPGALVWLGKLYGQIFISNEAYTQDYGKAFRYFELAANQNDTEAQLWLGTLLLRGHGAERDQERAITLLELSANQGYALAQYILGITYFEGKDIEQDYVAAERWFRGAAKLDFSNAEERRRQVFSLSSDEQKVTIYQEVLKDFAATAIRETNVSNIFSAGNAYETGFLFEASEGYFGFSVEPNITEAVRLYQIAANLNHAGAQYLLAKAYLTGNGIPQDYIMAHVWFNILGSRSGDEEEIRAMRDDVASRMTLAQIEEAQKLAKHWKPVRMPTP